MTYYTCNTCGHLSDEEKESKAWEELADDWTCPICESTKSMFDPDRAAAPPAPPQAGRTGERYLGAKKTRPATEAKRNRKA